MLRLSRAVFSVATAACVGFAWQVAAHFVFPDRALEETPIQVVLFVLSSWVLGGSMLLCSYALWNVTERTHRQLLSGAIGASVSVALFILPAIERSSFASTSVGVLIGGVLFVLTAHVLGRALGRRAAAT